MESGLAEGHRYRLEGKLCEHAGLLVPLLPVDPRLIHNLFHAVL